MNIYIIGGSPCSGKSTVAEIISKKCGLRYFKVDDYLDAYLKKGAADGKKYCAAIEKMHPEQIWMRPPALQCEEELALYEEIFAYVTEDLKKAAEKGAVITEGAAYLPCLVKKMNVPQERYLSITPTKEFQVSHYKEREWVPYVLEGCSDKEKAFANWMERDVLFAGAVQAQCREAGYVSVINDGSFSPDDMLIRVMKHFELL